MTRLPNLQEALIAAAARGEAVVAAPRRRRRRVVAPRAVVVALLVMLLAAAIAAAATGLLQQGSDVPTRSGQPPKATTRLGVATGTIAPVVTAPDTKDKDLAWGVRAFRTTRGYACLQIGRVQGGRLGLVGRDGAFSDDGKFHPLGPQVLDEGSCAPADARGRGFLVLHYAQYPASGYQAGCAAGALADMGFRAKVPRCPAGDLRTVDVGLLGPHAVSVAYRWPDGRTRRAPVQRATGAFLAVTPFVRSQQTRPGERLMPHQVPSQDFLVARSPLAMTILSVSYDDGTTCTVDHDAKSPGGGCPTPGYAPLAVRQPARAAVATKMSLSVTREADGRHRDLHVAFRARVAARGVSAAYYLMLYPPHHCHGTYAEGHAIEQDVRAGQRVGAKVRLIDGGCPGPYRVELSYRIVTRQPLFAGVTNLHYPGTRVASGTVVAR